MTWPSAPSWTGSTAAGTFPALWCRWTSLPTAPTCRYGRLRRHWSGSCGRPCHCSLCFPRGRYQRALINDWCTKCRLGSRFRSRPTLTGSPGPPGQGEGHRQVCVCVWVFEKLQSWLLSVFQVSLGTRSSESGPATQTKRTSPVPACPTQALTSSRAMTSEWWSCSTFRVQRNLWVTGRSGGARFHLFPPFLLLRGCRCYLLLALHVVTGLNPVIFTGLSSPGWCQRLLTSLSALSPSPVQSQVTATLLTLMIVICSRPNTNASWATLPTWPTHASQTGTASSSAPEETTEGESGWVHHRGREERWMMLIFCSVSTSSLFVWRCVHAPHWGSQLGKQKSQCGQMDSEEEEAGSWTEKGYGIYCL